MIANVKTIDKLQLPSMSYPSLLCFLAMENKLSLYYYC